MLVKFLVSCFILFLLQFTAFSQETGTLSVSLIDQNGDLISAGIVSVKDEQGNKIKDAEISRAKTSANFNLDFGNYILEINSPGFKPYQKKIEINKGINKIEIQLEIETIEINVEIQQDNREERLNEAFGGFLTEKELADLPESGEEIKEELKRRYGDDILIRIDGDFSGSQIPPLSQISSVKVIRNTFDAEFHEIAALIIDIRTKVAISSFNGMVMFTFNDSILNARNPFDTQRRPEQKRQILLFLSGPIIKKSTSFNFSTFGIDSFSSQKFLGRASASDENNPPKLKNRIMFSTFGIKHNLPNEHLLDFKYQMNDLSFFRLGAFDLPERGSTLSNPRHTFSLGESGTFKGKYFNEIRFEFGREFRKITPESFERTILVLDSFNLGSSGLNVRDETTRLKLVDNLMFDAGKHSVKVGTEIEYEILKSRSENNLNGRFIFSSLEDFEDGNPSQFSQTLGSTSVNLSRLKTSFYIQDYLKVQKTFQLSLGLRYGWQSDLKNNNNFSPRIGFVWSPEKSGKLIIRGGFGIFYNWLDTQTLSSVFSNDGRQGQNLIIINPSFPNPFDGGTVSQPLPISVSVLAENLKTPYIIASQNAVNYKLNNSVTFEGIYTFKKGLNHFRSRDVNAPINEIRPNPDFGRIQLLESSGTSIEHSFETKINAFYKGVNFFGNYQLAKRTSDFSDALSLPTDNYRLHLDRGFSNLDQRHKLNLNFNYDIGKNFKISPTIRIESGFPYTITTGTDDNGDTIFNDRPFGIGRNTERSEWLKQVDLGFRWKLSMKYFGFKAENQKRSINLNANIRNLFNTANFINYIGTQTSPFFGQPTFARTARSIDAGLSFNF